jgi:hypothetical protein
MKGSVRERAVVLALVVLQLYDIASSHLLSTLCVSAVKRLDIESRNRDWINFMNMSEFDHKEALRHESWRVFRIMSEFVDAIDTMARIAPAVSVFGSARTPVTNRYYQLAVECGRKLVEKDFAVITGGGPGIMEAANKGAVERRAPPSG